MGRRIASESKQTVRGGPKPAKVGLHRRLIRSQFDMDLARAPRRARLTARKKGSGYENAPPPNHLVPVFSCEKALNIKKYK